MTDSQAAPRRSFPGLGLLTSLVAPLRTSVQFRVIFTMVIVSALALGLIGTFISTTIRNGLFDQRMDAILQESARSSVQTQNAFNVAGVSASQNLGQLEYLLIDTVSSSANEREVSILRPSSAERPSPANDVSSASHLIPLISDELRASTVETRTQQWQSIALPTGAGSEVPGVVVGSTVNIPGEGEYELYFMYSLDAEHQTLQLIQRVLWLAGVSVLALIALVTWYVTRQTVRPVKQVAQAAERLADGSLDERLHIRGVDEMASLGRSFNEMADSLQHQIEQLAALSDVQRRFVSDVSHELRTPLTTVQMGAELIYGSRQDLDPTTRRAAELLYHQLQRFEDLLADLLEISRFDAGAAVLEAERIDLGSIVDQAVGTVSTLAQNKQVWLQVSIGTGPLMVDADARRIERIVRNLLVNAIEHAEGGPVEVTVAGGKDAVAVSVRDHGVGLTKQEAERVFDRFWRADPARTRTTGGTGLGLSISLEDAVLHGGWLEVWGRPGQGACFRLTLPRRAGITLTESPVPLVPQDQPMAESKHHVHGEATGPAALPEFGGGELMDSGTNEGTP